MDVGTGALQPEQETRARFGRCSCLQLKKGLQ
jgi:hypothetical protein